jgi:predicted RNA binding protein YcfA (HicA-like mRNA interferase family)
MSRPRRLTGKETIKALERIGFQVIRVKGSHHVMRHTDGRQTIIPVHAGEIIGIGLLSKILKQAEISRRDFEQLL